ncbi:MAG: hemolysin family protein, partial [Promicromonosporaceae bacterium]|nr:hemolysin family protein [Promicromonosporaceae bacterium]
LMDLPIALLWVIGATALALTAVLTAGEAAILRVTRASLAHALAAAEAGVRPADKSRASRIRTAKSLVSDPSSTVAVLASVRTVVCLIAGGCLTIALSQFWVQRWAVLLALLLVAIGVCMLAVAVSPRRFGHRQPLKVVIALAPVLIWVSALAAWTPKPSREEPHSDDDVRDMVDRVGESEAIEAEERELIRSVFELGDTIVREVMVPRTEMVTVSDDLTLRKAYRLMLRSGYSRVPVVGATVDDLLGIAYLKDVARLMDSDVLAGDRSIRQVMRPANFVPETKPVDDLLREMQSSVSHIAIVVDEYGGIAGLATIEDVIEELVGEVVDEHDSVKLLEPEQVNADLWRVPSRMPIDELGDLFGLELDDDDIDTVGGLLAKALGRVPLAGSAADFSGLHLVADRIEGRRKQVATVLVSRTGAEPVTAAPMTVVTPS